MDKELKMDQERAAFEAWLPDHYWLGEMEIAKDGEDYAHEEIQVAWEVWQAARQVPAAVVMPDRKPIEDDDPHAWQFEKGYNQALDDVARQSAGWRAQQAQGGES